MLTKAVHPGVILKDELDELSLTPTEFARQIDVPPIHVFRIIDGKYAITGDTALRFGHWFGNDPQFWLNLQDQYELADADRIKAGIEAGREELVPSEVVNRILDGENPVRVWRQHRGLSVKALAEASGLSAPYLSEIEGGRKTGSAKALKKIAAALGLSLDDLT